MDYTEMSDALETLWFRGMVLCRWSRDFALLPGKVVAETDHDGTRTITFRPPGCDLTGTLLYRGSHCFGGWWNAPDVVDPPMPVDYYPTRRSVEMLEMAA